MTQITSMTGKVLYQCDSTSLKNALVAAVKKRVDLREADLRRANLSEADLRRADLSEADLRGADFREADLREADLNWNSHDLLAEVLRQAAGDDVSKRKMAGLVLVSRDWCWDRFLALADEPLNWAIDTLAAYVRLGDNAPDVLKRRNATPISNQPVV